MKRVKRTSDQTTDGDCSRSGVAAQTNASCGCLDIALCVNYTGSLGDGIDGVKVGLIDIITTADPAKIDAVKAPMSRDE